MVESVIKAGADKAMARPLDEDLLLAFIYELLKRNPVKKSAP